MRRNEFWKELDETYAERVVVERNRLLKDIWRLAWEKARGHTMAGAASDAALLVAAMDPDNAKIED